MRQGQVVPQRVPLREQHQGTLPQRPADQGEQDPPQPQDGQEEECGIETPHEPDRGPDPGGAHGQNPFPNPSMDRGVKPLDVLAGGRHSVAPPTRPRSPKSTVPPPKSPAFVKNPILPARTWEKGLSNRLPTYPTRPTRPIMSPRPTTKV